MDRKLRFRAVNTVTNENMAIVWATSSRLIPLPVGLVGLNKAPMHRKNRTITIPRIIDQMDVVKNNR